MSQHSVTNGTSSAREDSGRKAYEPPVLEILDSDSTATGTEGTTSDGTIATSATIAGS